MTTTTYLYCSTNNVKEGVKLFTFKTLCNLAMLVACLAPSQNATYMCQ